MSQGTATAITEFFDFMTGKDYIPAITLPTRYDKKSCSLLDHIWVNKPSKSVFDPAKLCPRVFLKKIAKADHVPGILSLDILEQKTAPPKFINSQIIDDESLANFKTDLIASNILDSIDQSPNGNAEDTYAKINESLIALKEKHFPIRKVRFRRHQHKIQPWMTDIILLNIKLKDEAYVKFRKAKTVIERTKWKSKLKEMERDITEWITEAKANYYAQQLEKHINDIKKTWETIKTAIDKRRHKSAFPEFFKIGERNIFDRIETARIQRNIQEYL